MNGSYGTMIAAPQPQTTATVIDDLLRRELRVADPRNAVEVVTALRRRYVSEAARLDQEASGLPIRFQPLPVAPAPLTAAGETPGSREERRVLIDLESDLMALIDSRDNREWAPEIRGWRDVLLREVAEGTAAARLAQDPAMRDRGFLAVRKLGEFARVARLVGIFNLPLNCDYRRLASTLDDAANVIRILMGEALYNAGLADGGLIIQVPVTDVRIRRDTLILAVRRLAGNFGSSADEDWGDGVAAYRALLDELDRRSAPELAVYLREEFLVRVVDGLVGSISRQDPDTLRQVAATAPIEIARLRRLIVIAAPLAGPPLPPPALPNAPAAALSLFVQSLQLFVDAFEETRSGARLIDLAVPLPLAAQQTDEADRVSRRILRELVSLRGEFAAEVECFLSCCGCDPDDLVVQTVLDKVLFDIDRAIDLYAQGESYPPNWGDIATPPGVFVFSEERRASAYSVLFADVADGLAANQSELEEILRAMVVQLRTRNVFPPAGDRRDALLDEVFVEQFQMEQDWETLVASLAPRCLGRNELITAAGDRLRRIRAGRDLTRIPISAPPLPLRIGVQGIRDAITLTIPPPTQQRPNPRGGRGGGQTGGGGRTRATKRARKRPRRRAPLATQPSTAPDRTARGGQGPLSRGSRNEALDAQLIRFVDALATASGSPGELKSALNRERVREQWASLKRAGHAIPRDLEEAIDHVDATSRDHIDMDRVNAVLDRYRS